MTMESVTQEISLNCTLSTQTNSKKTYMIVTLFHGCSSKYEKHQADLDAEGNAEFQFRGVNVDTGYLCIQVFRRRMLLSNKHVGDVNLLLSDLVRVGGEPSSATYELGKTSKKSKKGSLELSYTLSNAVKELPAADVSSQETTEVESKRPASAIGNDIALFKTLPSFRTPLVSFAWN